MRIRIPSIVLSLCILAISCGKENFDPGNGGTTNGGGGNNTGQVPTTPDWPEDQCGKDYIWEEGVIPEIKVCVNLKNWDTFLQECDKNENTTGYIRCNVVFDNDYERDSVVNAGIRLKDNAGVVKNTSIRPEGNKGDEHQTDPSLWNMSNYEINFSKFNTSLRKVDAIFLKSCRNDPSYSREMFCSRLMEKFGIWTTPRNKYCRLSIHVSGDESPVYIGVYQLKEVINSSYLEERKQKFGTSNGFLWKCNTGATLSTPAQNLAGKESTSAEYTYTLINNHQNFTNAKTQLSDFISKINTLKGENFATWIKSVLDVRLLLNTYAVIVTTGMWNDYWNMGENYYLYFNSTNTGRYKAFFIPDDFENSLGNAYVKHMLDPGRQDPYKWGNSAGKLIEKILSIPEFRDIYTKALTDLCTEGYLLFNAADSPSEIANLMYSVSFYTKNDIGKLTAAKDITASWSSHRQYVLRDTNSDNNFFKVRSETIMAAVEAEKSSISSQHN